MRGLSTRMCQNFASSVRRVMQEVQKVPQAKEKGARGQEAGRPFTVVVEGNIGSGKSTFLEHFRQFGAEVRQFQWSIVKLVA